MNRQTATLLPDPLWDLVEPCYSLVRDVRSFPLGLEDVSRLAIATAVPLLPLLLTVFSLEDLLARVIQVVF